MSQYDDLVGPRGQEILRQLYPHLATTDCPLTADAVDDYLQTSRIEAVQQSFSSRYNISANWRRVNRQQLVNTVRSMGSNHHVVVRGTRPHGSALAPTHFFVLANIGNRVYVVDAMTREVNPDIGEYITRQGFTRLDFTRSFEAAEDVEY